MKTIIIDNVEYNITPKETKEETGRWVPEIEIEDEYWCIGANEQDVDILKSTFENDAVDKFRILTGNMYPTKEAAEKALAQKQALQRIYEYMDKEGLWVEPDFSDDEPRWQIVGWDYADNMPRIDFYASIDMSQHHLIFRTVEDRQKVLENCANDLKIVLKNY